MIKWFAADNWDLNLDKTDTMKFITKDSKFLGLQIDNHINWTNHIEQMIRKLSAACYAVRPTVHISDVNTPKLIYYA